MNEHGGACRADGTISDENAESERKTTDETDDPESESEDEAGSETRDDGRADRSHLDDVADGSGCTEIWEYLSEQRDTAETERE